MRSDYTPNLDEVRDRYADDRVGIGEWTRVDDSVKRAVEEAYGEFDRWLAAHDQKMRATAVLALRDEMAQTIASGDVAEVAAPVEGEVGRQEVIDARDELYEDPLGWVEGYLERAEQSALAREAVRGTQ